MYGPRSEMCARAQSPRRASVAWAAALVCAALFPRPASAEPAAPTPDPRRGEALFVGTARLSGGGAPCLGCHGVAGHGLAHAASFGPDLSGAYEQFGADGLDGLLEDVVFPSMAPIYARHAVTKPERADLVAFLAGATGGTSPSAGGRYAAGVVAAMAAFLAFVVVLGRRGRRARPTDSATATAGRTP